jgi:UPF0755 protein
VRFLAYLFLVLLLVAAGAAGWLWYSVKSPYQGFSSDGVFVDVPHGASRRTVSHLLQKNGVVRSALAFEIYARRHPRRTLQAGEYFFGRPATVKDVFDTLASGNVYSQPFIVREGETMFDIGRDLEAGKFMAAKEFIFAATNPASIHDLAPQARTLEGFLFPSTYRLPRHPAAADLTADMVKKFKEEWAQISFNAINGEQSAEPSRPAESVVTLASLVERETPRPEERPVVAGVFENRLRKGIPLQCDPTVIYALERAGQYKGALTGKDLHFDSAYNTYQNRGLPPGPIGNPGEASLRAALHPAQTDYLYFVANTQGGHFFGATLAQHNKNVVKYRRLLAGLPAEPPPAPPAPHVRKKTLNKTRKGAAR